MLSSGPQKCSILGGADESHRVAAAEGPALTSPNRHLQMVQARRVAAIGPLQPEERAQLLMSSPEARPAQSTPLAKRA